MVQAKQISYIKDIAEDIQLDHMSLAQKKEMINLFSNYIAEQTIYPDTFSIEMKGLGVLYNNERMQKAKSVFTSDNQQMYLDRYQKIKKFCDEAEKTPPHRYMPLGYKIANTNIKKYDVLPRKKILDLDKQYYEAFMILEDYQNNS